MRREAFVNPQKSNGLVVEEGAAIPDCAENREFLARIEEAEELTPRQLLSLAGVYRGSSATRSLSQHLAERAMAKIVANEGVEAAVSEVSRAEVEWSFFGDLWDDVKNFFTGGTDDKDPTRCKHKCVGAGFLGIGVLVEKCGPEDDWHLIGTCVKGSF